ncbi:hypothetical protein LIER_01438 [Lithospermum erythrorhizon]|uniref:Uncharacterized protein n=1 Tax=Lithospermum erythrorhizon TaxID=34254 RepID=A0AAV3NL03_LITER
MQEKSATMEYKSTENKQFLPFIPPPSPTSVISSTIVDNPSPPASPAVSMAHLTIIKNSSPPTLHAKSDINVDLQDVLAAAESAERAAASARSAARLAQLRSSELEKTKKDDEVYDAPCRSDAHTPMLPRHSHLNDASSSRESEGVPSRRSPQYNQIGSCIRFQTFHHMMI